MKSHGKLKELLKKKNQELKETFVNGKLQKQFEDNYLVICFTKFLVKIE